MKVTIIIFVFFLQLLIEVQNFDKEIEKLHYGLFLSSKTPYRFIENLNETVIQYQGCVPRRIWSVIRHGTRTPGNKLKKSIYNRLFKIKDALMHQNDTYNLHRWSLHEEFDDQKRLTGEGEIEMEELGARMRKRFPSIIPKKWDKETFTFRSTNTSRTRASLKYFIIGMFGKKEAERVEVPEPLKYDAVLRFYKMCPKWKSEVKKNKNTLAEVRKFEQTLMFKNLIKNVEEKLGLPKGYLTVDDVQTMYSVCAFETAWDRKKKSPWCDIFSTEEFKIMQYLEDLEYFAKHGSKYEITEKIACTMFNDAILNLEADDSGQAVFYFTHSGTILKLLTHLGLARDMLVPTADNYHKMEYRLWSLSKIDSFASNVAFVRFDCNGKQKYILTMHQERPVRLPGCPVDSDLCPLNFIKQYYEEYLNECDLGKLCLENKTFVSYFKYFFHRMSDFLWNISNYILG